MEKRGKWAIWSEAEDSALKEACHGRTLIGMQVWDGIGENFPGRSALACRQRWLFLRDKATGKAPRDRNRERSAGYRRRTQKEMMEAKRVEVRQAAIAEFEAPSHKSITAYVFGDPLPGRSALDQKQQEQRA